MYAENNQLVGTAPVSVRIPQKQDVDAGMRIFRAEKVSVFVSIR